MRLSTASDFPDTVAVFVLGPVAMIVGFARWVPETIGRELEEISYEPGVRLALGPAPATIPGRLSGPANLIEPEADPWPPGPLPSYL